MDTILFADAAQLDEEAMIDRVVAYAERYYGGEAAADDLRRWTAEAVAHVWGDGVLVRQFVPLLALREVRERVRGAGEGRSAA